jgi:hypothetical protein
MIIEPFLTSCLCATLLYFLQMFLSRAIAFNVSLEYMYAACTNMVIALRVYIFFSASDRGRYLSAILNKVLE